MNISLDFELKFIILLFVYKTHKFTQKLQIRPIRKGMENILRDFSDLSSWNSDKQVPNSSKKFSLFLFTFLFSQFKSGKEKQELAIVIFTTAGTSLHF